MVQYFPYLLLLMVAIMLLIMFANRLKVAYPILLVLGGLAISFIPNLTASSVCRCFFAITERDVEVAPHYL